MPQTTAIGNAAEDLAQAYLEAQGLKCITRNYRCRFGEIDLVCFDGDSWVFVEVKNRKNNHYGLPVETVTASKRKKIIATAQIFLAQAPEAQAKRNANVRFDVIGIENLNSDSILWVQSAFDCSC